MKVHSTTWKKLRWAWRSASLALSRAIRARFARIGRTFASPSRVPQALQAAASAMSLVPQLRPSRAHVERVVLQADDDASHVFRRLQGPGPKILDLRQVEISAAFFDQLADAWQAPPGMVPRLAIVLDYHRWVVFHNVARSRLTSLNAREVEVEIVYGQLHDLGRLAAWFERGRLVHAMPTVVEWLRTEWTPTEIWPWVLDVTARMVEATVSVDEVPQLLLEISDIARSCGAEIDEATEAAKHAHTALHWIGNAPSATRHRALRAIASTAETAVTVARVNTDTSKGVWGLIDLGMEALECRRFAAAEAAFVRATIMAPTHAASLRAMIHQQLSIALAQQSKHDEASRHAELAAGLHSGSWPAPTREGPWRQRLSPRSATPNTGDS